MLFMTFGFPAPMLFRTFGFPAPMLFMTFGKTKGHKQLRSRKTKGHKQHSQNQLRSPLSLREECFTIFILPYNVHNEMKPGGRFPAPKLFMTFGFPAPMLFMTFGFPAPMLFMTFGFPAPMLFMTFGFPAPSFTIFILPYNVHNEMKPGGHRGLDHMVVGFTTTCAISAYHH
jgi:hypothetical protein